MRIISGCRHKKSGFTLLELMIACAIIIVGLTGVLATFVTSSDLIETTKNTNLALNAEQKVLEQMRRGDFLSLYSSYNGYTFNVSNIAAGDGLGRVTVNNSNAKRLQVDIGVCWRQRGGRIIGECVSNNTSLVFSETNANGILDSPAQITTYMAQR
jgi:type II secretory pathway pseudopilin PulG